jgi:penicillin-binding protein 1A
MGRFRDALIAAEGDPQDESTFRDTARTFVIKEFPRRKALYSAQLARRLNCPGAKSLEHTVKSIRTAIQIERRFTSDEILTIYANSAYFGNDTYGIENASQTYFKKMAMQLSVSEAATLAGLIRRPDYLLKHPDRAVERRNEVLDAMLQKQLVSIKEAEEARSEPLNLGPKK